MLSTSLLFKLHATFATQINDAKLIDTFSKVKLLSAHGLSKSKNNIVYTDLKINFTEIKTYYTPTIFILHREGEYFFMHRYSKTFF